MPSATPTAPTAVDTAAALVTTCLEAVPNRRLIDTLLDEAEDGGYLRDLTAALAFGFAANVEGIAQLTGQDPQELWQAWCRNEAADPQRYRPRRPFTRPEYPGRSS